MWAEPAHPGNTGAQRHDLSSHAQLTSTFLPMTHDGLGMCFLVYMALHVTMTAPGRTVQNSCLTHIMKPSPVNGTRRQAYGDLYSESSFHHRRGDGFSQHGNCQIQPQDFFHCADCVQQCDLGGLADLDTSQASVQVFGLFTVPPTHCDVTTFPGNVTAVTTQCRSPAW